MKKYNITISLNGNITYEIEANNKEEGKQIVKDMVEHSSFKELIENGHFNIEFTKINTKNKENER